MKCKNCGDPVMVRHPREGLVHIDGIVLAREKYERARYACKNSSSKVAE